MFKNIISKVQHQFGVKPKMPMCPYVITWNSLPDKLVEALPHGAQERFVEIAKGVKSGDVKMIPKIKMLIKEYPHLPKLYNFLHILYVDKGNEKLTHKLIVQTEGNYDLKSLYPDRLEFHISEFLTFTYTMCLHACHKKDFVFVRQTLDALKTMDLQCNTVSVLEARLAKAEQLAMTNTITARKRKK